LGRDCFGVLVGSHPATRHETVTGGDQQGVGHLETIGPDLAGGVGGTVTAPGGQSEHQIVEVRIGLGEPPRRQCHGEQVGHGIVCGGCLAKRITKVLEASLDHGVDEFG
jgi:hypothetical protein